MSIPATEYAPFYAGYVKNVTSEIITELEQQATSFATFILAIPPHRADYAYATGKWTVKEAIGHVLDTERVMAYRALCFARDGKTPQPAFDENVFAQRTTYASRTLASLAEEFILLRKSNLMLFKSFDAGALQQLGIANEQTISVRGLLYVIAGHLIHHQNILQERYLNS